MKELKERVLKLERANEDRIFVLSITIFFFTGLLLGFIFGYIIWS